MTMKCYPEKRKKCVSIPSYSSSQLVSLENCCVHLRSVRNEARLPVFNSGGEKRGRTREFYSFDETRPPLSRRVVSIGAIPASSPITFTSSPVAGTTTFALLLRAVSTASSFRST